MASISSSQKKFLEGELLNLLGEEKPVSQNINKNSVSGMLYKFGEASIKAMKDNLGKSGKNASNELSQSISFTTKIYGSSYTLRISLADYYVYVDQGRRKGKQPPPDSILKWIDNKPQVKAALAGIKEKESFLSKKKSLAFLIGRKIARKGVKGSDFYSSVINDESIAVLTKSVSEQIKKDVIITVKHNLE